MRVALWLALCALLAACLLTVGAALFTWAFKGDREDERR